jgi:hypothetical protein
VSVPLFLPKYHSVRRAKRSRAAILHVEQYSQRIDQNSPRVYSCFRSTFRARQWSSSPIWSTTFLAMQSTLTQH